MIIVKWLKIILIIKILAVIITSIIRVTLSYDSRIIYHTNSNNKKKDDHYINNKDNFDYNYN